MVCIVGGAFLRGIDRDRARKLGAAHRPSTPQSTVVVSTFLLDRTEVTVEAWRACVKAGACRKNAGPNYADFDAPKQPITGVNWHDAVAFCSAQQKRLPTEAEWEKAARGVDGRMFPWGDEPATCDRAVFMNNKGRSCGKKQSVPKFADVGRPEPVGSRPVEPQGTFDMAGNSWEWVADWFSPTWDACGADCAGVDPKGPCGGRAPCAGHHERVVRGGSWYWPADHMATWYRRPHTPSNAPIFHHFGFRCAADVAPSSSSR
jgi:formylglycine-generating enzyme required for sulfatase activity